jgi:5-hydroxyisourate hydrolase
MSGASISTHVLDTTRGLPAPGVSVRLLRQEGRELVEIGSGATGENGRIDELASGGVAPGWYQLVFDLDPYYGSQQHFISRVTLDISIADERHHHVPLLVSPYSATSYRGS